MRWSPNSARIPLGFISHHYPYCAQGLGWTPQAFPTQSYNELTMRKLRENHEFQNPPLESLWNSARLLLGFISHHYPYCAQDLGWTPQDFPTQSYNELWVKYDFPNPFLDSLWNPSGIAPESLWDSSRIAGHLKPFQCNHTVNLLCENYEETMNSQVPLWMPSGIFLHSPRIPMGFISHHYLDGAQCHKVWAGHFKPFQRYHTVNL